MAARTHSNIATSKDKLIDDLQMVVADAEALLQATASQAGESAVAARSRIQKSLHIVKERLIDAEEAVIERSKEAAKATDEYAHDNPWKAIGVTAALGLIAGMLIARR
ncbi:MAG: DUF883 family protein [Sideroxyarcus sp.]|nr:DUF883 family protein [Sideroxyarcus sp.]